jgi:hypothetical protein
MPVNPHTKNVPENIGRAGGCSSAISVPNQWTKRGGAF